MSLLFRTTISRYGGKDIIVFDMPPTALALRFFAAPSVSTIWIEQLIALRSIILERKEMITRVTLASSTVETDKILQRLERERTLYAGQTEALQREGSAIHIVINPDELSRQEGRRIGRELTALNLPLGRSMLNKADVTAGMDFDEELPAPLLLPRSAFELTGIEALHRYLEMHGAALLAS
jgi:arsenite/tail-anchored protein-transporting ATPase